MYEIRNSYHCQVGTYYNFQIQFGAITGYEVGIKQFYRSVNRDQISFTCAAWCGLCGPISGPIRFEHSMEFSEFEKAFLSFLK